MKIISRIKDERISAINILIEMSIRKYLDLIEEVIDKNEFQRKRVRSSKTVYALLKEDLKKGCVMPPLVIALPEDLDTVSKEYNLSDNELVKYIEKNKKLLLILDGLQRTLTIKDLLNEEKQNNHISDKVNNQKIRIELYVGINRLSILYRMLTLNTGQTPMSIRQQIEMLYLDYLDNNINGVSLIRDKDNISAKNIGEYDFNQIIEGFNAYLDRDPSPIVRNDILDNIKSLEKLSNENQNYNLFESYVEAYHKLVVKINELCPSNIELSDEYVEKYQNEYFEKSAYKIFKKPQIMSGFGAALGKLVDFEFINNISEIENRIEQLKLDDPQEFIDKMNMNLVKVKNNSKKIGTAQRDFFMSYFRDLFSNESESYLDLLKSCDFTYRKYEKQNF